MSFQQGLSVLQGSTRNFEKLRGGKPGQEAARRSSAAVAGARQTTRIAIQMNADARAAITAPASGQSIVFRNPATYNNAAALTIHDAKGQDIVLVFYLQKAMTDLWNLFVTANGVPVGVDGVGAPQPSAKLRFSRTGAAAQASSAVRVDIPAGLDLGGTWTMAVGNVLLDLSAVTQHDAAFGVKNLTQDGAPGGEPITEMEQANLDWIHLIAEHRASQSKLHETKAQEPLQPTHI
jgi:flagellar hook protein FlgE